MYANLVRSVGAETTLPLTLPLLLLHVSLEHRAEVAYNMKNRKKNKPGLPVEYKREKVTYAETLPPTFSRWPLGLVYCLPSGMLVGPWTLGTQAVVDWPDRDAALPCNKYS